MSIYFLLLLYLYIFSMLEVWAVKIPYGIKVLSFLLLVIIMGFRNEVGSDYGNYVDIFNHPDWYIDTIEPGCILLMESLQTIGLNAQAFFVVSSFLILLPISYVVEKIIPSFFHLALCLYVISFLYFEAMNTVRQGIAMAFCFWALYEFRNNKWFIAFIIVIASFCFHKSSIVVVAIYFIFSFIKYNRFLFLLLIFISFFLGFYIADFFSDYALLFMRSDYSVEKRGVSSGIFQVFLNIMAFSLVLFSKYHNSSSKISLLSKLYLLSVIIYNIFINYYIVLRLYFYFYMSLIVLIPFILTCQKKFLRVFSFNLLFIIFAIYSIVSLNNSNYNKYQFNFNMSDNFYIYSSK